jgi:rhamnulokinase
MRGAVERRVTSGSVVAVDLGASTGRVIVGHIDRDRLDLEDVHRFPNDPVRLPDGLHWDALRLFHEIVEGLRRAGRSAPDLASIGIDSWAIDYGLLDASGALLYQPYHYRDGGAASAIEAVHARVTREELYARTGLQFLPFNTLYQLAAAREMDAFGAARTVLLMPDLFGYWLTGIKAAERTNASTTGLFDARTGNWAEDLMEAVGISPALFPTLRSPGDELGPLEERVTSEIGLPSSVPVTMVGSHDTASAIVGVPADGDRFAYIACGTWSLVGVELTSPILTDASRAANFTNEAGVDGRVRYLRNVMGLWLLQELLRTWENAGAPESLVDLLAAASRLPDRGPLIDPDEAAFLPPGDMEVRINEACRVSDQPVPSSRTALVRCILDSLAAAHARALRDATRLSGHVVETVHIVGGGARNELLCQLTANACGLPVVAGPVEATALGNVLVQARALGFVEGDLEALRAMIRATHPLRRFEPRRTGVETRS